MNKEQALEKIKELENYIKELDSKPNRFKAENREKYWLISSNNATTWTHNDNVPFDIVNYVLGNMFETEQQAEYNKEKHLKKLEILEWMEDNRKEFEFEGENYVIQSWGKDSDPSFFDFTSQVSKYCFTEKKAQDCIDKFGQDLKLIFE